MMTDRLITQEFWSGRRVLVTGHTGFKGSWLSLWLQELGAQVTGVGLEPNTNPSLFRLLRLDDVIFTNHYKDIRTPSALREIVDACQPEVVFHLAAQPLVHQSYIDPLFTWSTNVMGALNLLEALRDIRHPCACVMVTTDKVYENQEWDFGYRENDRLGGYDPYSASKAACELAVASWRNSFCGKDSTRQTPFLAITTARAGNVIGGGDWSKNRIMPDIVRALSEDRPIVARNPHSTRPWQHVLEPILGYLRLAEVISKPKIYDPSVYHSAFNFGPPIESCQTVKALIQECLSLWPGEWSSAETFEPKIHETSRLYLNTDKSRVLLDWQPRLSFSSTVAYTVGWYKLVSEGHDPYTCCKGDIERFSSER